MSELIFSKFDEQGRQQIFDPSSLGDADKCLQYYKLRQIDRWFSKTSRISAKFGTLVHACLEEYDRALLKTSQKEAERAAVKKAFELAPELAESDDTARTPNTLIRAVVFYTDMFRDDPLVTAQIGDGEVAVEVRFEVPILGTEWRISMRLDRIVFWGKDLFLVDRKTTKMTLSDRYFNAFLPGMQFEAYLWATRKYLGLDPKGMIVEAYQTMVNGGRWQRKRLTVWNENLDIFEKDLLQLVNLIDECHKNNHWPLRRTSCNLYGSCEFRHVCNAAPSQKDRYLRDKFEITPYQPPT